MTASPALEKSYELHRLSDITTKEHSFKNPNRKTPVRRFKPARQIISDEVKYLQSKTNIKYDTPTYTSIAAPPSLMPAKNYCDITGLLGKYKSPSNGLRFYNVEIYQEVIKNMPPSVDQEYLELRGAHVILK